LETDLFNAGVRPAINAGLSVSRVGSAAQIKAMKQVAGKLKLELAQYRSLAAFAQFASDLDKSTQAQLARGQRLTELMKQTNYAPYVVTDQVMSIFAATNGFMDTVPVEDVSRFEKEFLAYVHERYPELVQAVTNEKAFSKESEATLKSAAGEFLGQFKPSA
jgi:F-type H+-transporting ATPase subunit alpha